MTEENIVNKLKAKNLVLRSISEVDEPMSWYTAMDSQDKRYIKDVLEELSRQPVATLHAVATELKKELEITVGVRTITRTLREMIRNAEEEKKSK